MSMEWKECVWQCAKCFEMSFYYFLSGIFFGCLVPLESDQSSTSKTGTIEMYAPASGSGGSYNNGVTETSLSGSEEENKSEGAYSGQTDYAMVRVLNSMSLVLH